DEPSGWLFGERPLKEGQKRVREDWEIIWYVGFWGTTLFGIITQVYKPNKSITTWARKEAEENMEKPTYEKS
ncbi:ESSS subunit of NADH:ubiquinone oxidoreductase, partial [Phakopsora pachyrhizi]